ncbi:threonine/serine dehydratase [soil metagenome]
MFKGVLRSCYDAEVSAVPCWSSLSAEENETIIGLEDIEVARRRLQGVALRTPLVPCPGGPRNRALYFKPESLQPTGAFKLRGAYNKISSLSSEERGRGVVAHSSGNHAQAVAYAARALNTRAVVVMPRGASRVKLDATAELGAEVVLVGPGSADRSRKAEELAQEHGYVPVPPYDDEVLMAGQGTIGPEILEDLPDVETVLVPVSGGGLIGGISAAMKLPRPKVRVIGVEPELAADARASLESGSLVEFPAEQVARTVADGLRVQRLGEAPFEHIRAFVDDIITVTEEEILEAMRRLALRVRLVAEPSGAVTFAAYLFHREELPAPRLTVAVISGGNVEPGLLARVLDGSTLEDARNAATR